MRIGLNPYGLTWMLGSQGQGTLRANPAGRGLPGFLEIADELGARVLEIFDPWLQALSDADVSDLLGRATDLVREARVAITAGDQTSYDDLRQRLLDLSDDLGSERGELG